MSVIRRWYSTDVQIRVLFGNAVANGQAGLQCHVAEVVLQTQRYHSSQASYKTLHAVVQRLSVFLLGDVVALRLFSLTGSATLSPSWLHMQISLGCSFRPLRGENQIMTRAALYIYFTLRHQCTLRFEVCTLPLLRVSAPKAQPSGATTHQSLDTRFPQSIRFSAFQLGLSPALIAFPQWRPPYL